MNFNAAKYRNNKTGNVYYVYTKYAIESTNGREDIPYTIYTNAEKNKVFVRETKEFNNKFTLCERE
ncbi:hypothetical protein HDR60_03230 [bacterium]|nr:hypothetical protein [bacterium]